MGSSPPFLPEVIAHWQAKLNVLSAANRAAKENITFWENERREHRATDEQVTSAWLQELQAAQTYNSFLESGSQYIKTALDAESRLQRRNLSLLEIVQLATTRDTMYALAAEFTRFKSDNGMSLLQVPPVEVGGKTHYIDGRVGWSSSLSGLAGQAWEGLQEIAAGVKEALLRGPFTTEENQAICRSALGSLLPDLAGKTIAAPGGKPGAFLWDEALSKALDAADPAGQMCRVVYPPGTSPQDIWRYGQVIESVDPVSGSAFTAVLFMPPELAEARVVDAFVEAGADDAWNELVEALGSFTGMDDLPDFDPADSWSASGPAQDNQAFSSGGEEAVDSAEEQYALGDGPDQLAASDALQSERDIVDLLALQMDQQWRREGAYLAQDAGGTQASLLPGDVYSDPGQREQALVFRDGQAAQERQLQSLIEAMAQFAPPPPGTASWGAAAYAPSLGAQLTAPQ